MKTIFKLSLCALIVSTCVVSNAQDVRKSNKIIRRIKIRSADPALIAALLSGKQNYNLPPELSTVNKNQGNSGNLNGNNSGGNKGG